MLRRKRLCSSEHLVKITSKLEVILRSFWRESHQFFRNKYMDIIKRTYWFTSRNNSPFRVLYSNELNTQ